MMDDQRRTKAELLDELAALRARVAELEQAQADLPSADRPSEQHSSRDAQERRRVQHMLEGQRHFFEQLATGAPLTTVLGILARTLEQQIKGGRCSIMLLDGQGQHLFNGAAPSLPEAYTLAIDGSIIGPAVGSCGTAAYRGETVIVADIDSDPLWADYRDLALSYGLRA